MKPILVIEECTVLELRSIDAFYDDPSNLALRDVSFELGDQSIAAIVGPNGAGKSTVLKAIAGKIHILCGEISFEGRLITTVPPHRICHEGIGYVPEGQRVWLNLTVDENLRMGAFSRADRRSVHQDLLDVYDNMPRLQSLRDRKCHTLSGGERQMVAVGRALMGKPRCLLIDEPSLGLSPGMVDEVFALLTSVIRAKDISALIVEQNCLKAMQVADRVMVMNQGRLALDKPASEVEWERDIAPIFFEDTADLGLRNLE